MTDTDIMIDTMMHFGERRRVRIRGYYVCRDCSNQYVYWRPTKERKCPVCGHLMPICNTVDEFEVARIREWSEETVLIEGEKSFPYLCTFLHRKWMEWKNVTSLSAGSLGKEEY